MRQGKAVEWRQSQSRGRRRGSTGCLTADRKLLGQRPLVSRPRIAQYKFMAHLLPYKHPLLLMLPEAFFLNDLNGSLVVGVGVNENTFKCQAMVTM